MHRETVAPIYIRIFGPQTVKTAHGIDDRKAQSRRTLLFGPLIKAFEDMVRIERTARTAVADAQTIPGNGHRHFAARISVNIGVFQQVRDQTGPQPDNRASAAPS